MNNPFDLLKLISYICNTTKKKDEKMRLRDGEWMTWDNVKLLLEDAERALSAAKFQIREPDSEVDYNCAIERVWIAEEEIEMYSSFTDDDIARYNEENVEPYYGKMWEDANPMMLFPKEASRADLHMYGLI